MTQKLNVAAFMSPKLGHQTYADLLQREYRNSADISFVPYWWNDRQDLAARIIYRMLSLPLPIPKGIGYATLVRRILQSHCRHQRPDVLYFHPQNAAWLVGDYIAKFRTVISLDQTAIQHAVEKSSAPWRAKAGRAIELQAFRKASVIVPFSEWAARSLIDDYGLPEEKIRVIRPGADLRQFSELQSIRSTLQVGGTKRILFIGGDFKRKGGLDLIAVFLEHCSDQNVELHIASNAADIPTGRNIIVHRDIVAYSDAWKRLYATADIFVLPTKYDLSPHVLVEAMAAGIPSIATKINAIPEIVEDGKTGLLIPPGDRQHLAESLRALLHDDSMRQRFGVHALERAKERFDATKAAETLQNVFLDLKAKDIPTGLSSSLQLN